MKHTSLALLPTFALGLVACADIQSPVTPRAATMDHAVTTAAPATPGGPTTVIYSNFGPEMTFDTNPLHGWTINGFLGPAIGQQAISQQFFTPAGEYAFARASVALSHFSGPARIRIFLQADSSGRPGHVIDQLSIDSIGHDPAIYSVSSSISPVLTDTLYWLTVAAGDAGVRAGWSWNSIGDASSTTFAGTQGGGPSGPWGIGLKETRSAFQVEGRQVPPRGAVVHDVSAGGIVLWGTGEKSTVSVHALQMADGSVKGDVHLQAGQSSFDEHVTCLLVVRNRAYLAGYFPDHFGFPATFALILEDNGEGSKATAPDRIAGLAIILFGGDPPVCHSPYSPYILTTDWTHGNVQVR